MCVFVPTCPRVVNICPYLAQSVDICPYLPQRCVYLPHDSPMSILLRVLTPTQSAAHEENLPQWLSWQSSWQGSWHVCVRGGMGLEYFRHAPMSTSPPSNFRHDTAGQETRRTSCLKHIKHTVLSLKTKTMAEQSVSFFQNFLLHSSSLYVLLPLCHMVIWIKPLSYRILLFSSVCQTATCNTKQKTLWEQLWQ